MWQFKKRKLIVEIIFIFISIFMITIFSIIFYSFTESSAALIKLGSQLVESQNKAVVDKLDDFLRPISVINIATYLLSDDELDPHDMASLTSFMHTMLQTNPQLVSVYLADTKGNLFIENRLTQNELNRGIISFINTKKLPLGAKYLSEILSFKNNRSTVTLKYKNATGNVILIDKKSDILFDPRNYPWYVAAKDLRNQYWLGIYKFLAENDPILTISFPIRILADTKLVGVTAIDVAMKSIAEQIKNIAISNKGMLFIVNDHGEIITSKSAVMTKNIGERLPHINEINSPIWSMAYNLNKAHGKNKFTFTYQNVTYIAHFTPYALSASNQWVIVSIMPLENFIGALNHANHRVIIFSLFMLSLGLILVVIFAHRISRPISQLALETKEIVNLQFAKKIHIKSGIQEIQDMIDSLNAAKIALASFAKYIPKNLVTQLLQNKMIAELGGEKKNITVLFTDITNFTKIAERIDPEFLMIHISEYLNELTKCIHEHSGNIDKYIGDAIMAFWGAPLHDNDHVAHACEAVLACREVVHQLNAKWKGLHKPILNTRFGLSSGTAIVGNMGSADRLNYTMLGDIVNLAARYENLNKNYHTEIIVSRSVYTQCRLRYLFRPLDIVTVRGKEKSTHIFELVAGMGEFSNYPATQEQIEFCALFSKGFELYYAESYQKALQIFQETQALSPTDTITQLYIDRCRGYLENPKT